MTDMAAVGLQPVRADGWRSGLAPLMRAEFSSWWGTRMWLLQAVLWTVVINGSIAVAVWGEAPDGVGPFALYSVMTMFAAIAVAILMQEAIVGEKRTGTAAWVMSKPASRQSFMLAKLVPNAVGVIVTMVLIPSVFVLLQVMLAGVDVSAGLFALGTVIVALNLMFYLTLTLMLGTLFDSAGPVIAIPLAFAFGQQLISGLPIVGSLLPWALVVSAGSETSVAASVITGQGVTAPGAIVVAVGACIVFTAVAFWKWSRTEL
jgi:ABC-2 type transport system permease protein